MFHRILGFSKVQIHIFEATKQMRKFLAVMMCLLVLLTACNKETPVIPPLPPDQSDPTLSFEFVSVASTVQFIAFGDTLPNQRLNTGYRLKISNTNESVLAACSGIVTSISADTMGGNYIKVKYKSNSIYSFVYAGVSNVQVHINDTLRAGSILGRVNSSGIIDFQLIKNNNTAMCPYSFGSPGFNTAIDQAIARNNLFYPTDSVTQPCAAQSLPY